MSSDNHRFAEQCADHFLKTRDRPALDAYVQKAVPNPKQRQAVTHLIDQYIAKKSKPKTKRPGPAASAPAPQKRARPPPSYDAAMAEADAEAAAGKEDEWGFYEVAQEGDDEVDDEIELADGDPGDDELAENDGDDEDDLGGFDVAAFKTASGAVDFKAAEAAFKKWRRDNADKNISLKRFMAMVQWVESDDAEEMPEDAFQRARYEGTVKLIRKDERRIADIDEALADPETSKKDIRRLQQMREHAVNTIEERKQELARIARRR